MSASLRNDQATPNRRTRGMLRNLIKEPYWVGSINQVTLIVACIGMVVYGNVFGLGVLAFIALTTHIPPLIKLYLVRKSISEKSPDEDFEIRYKDKPHLHANFSPEHTAKRTKNPYYDNVIYLFHFLHYLVFFCCLFAVAYTDSYSSAIILAMMLGIYYAPVAESYSHEFIHRRSIFQQMLGGSVWASFCYGTFLPEHCMGHHVHVSTPEDPSSAPKGMTVYQFLPQALSKNALNGFKLEAKKLRNRGHSPWSLNNRLIWLTLFSSGLALASYLIADLPGIVFFLAQSIGGVVTIEVANYVMHYGLQRKKLANGRYERISPLHSWNREGISNFGVIGLMRHSDHHAFPRRPFQILRDFPESPELPLPYELMLYMPYFPKLWFKIMDPSVDEHMNKLSEWRKSGIDDYKMVMGIDATRIQA